MNISDIRPFLETNHRAVVTSFRRNGAAQVSILVAGFYQEAVVFVISGSTAKLANLSGGTRAALSLPWTPTGPPSQLWKAPRRSTPRRTQVRRS